MGRSDYDRLFFSNDFAADLRLPVIVITHERLGCLNHIRPQQRGRRINVRRRRLE